MTSKKGLTIIELLIAMVLLGVLATAVLAPLTGLFQMTGRSSQTLNATTQAQEIVEYIQGQWRSYPRPQNVANPTPQDERNREAYQQSLSRYAQTCLENFPSTRDGLRVEVTVWALDGEADQRGARPIQYRSACPAVTAASPPMQRVNVTVQTDDPNNAASLTVDIPRP